VRRESDPEDRIGTRSESDPQVMLGLCVLAFVVCAFALIGLAVWGAL
jgi:hypothetical protein